MPLDFGITPLSPRSAIMFGTPIARVGIVFLNRQFDDFFHLWHESSWYFPMEAWPWVARYLWRRCPVPAKYEPEFTAKELQGFKYFRMIDPLLQRLHVIGT